MRVNVTIRPVRVVYVLTLCAIAWYLFDWPAALIAWATTFDVEMK